MAIQIKPEWRENNNVLNQHMHSNSSTVGEEPVYHSEAQECLLAYGPNFAIAPNREYIATVEQACQKLNQGEADELQVEIRGVPKKDHPQNITSTKKGERHSRC